MKTLAIYAALTGALVVLAVSQAVAVNNDVSRAKLDYTKLVCDKSHNDPTGDNEKECGDMQTQTHTEYICNNTGTSCWLEVH